MKLHTASEVVSFARKLEDESARFYQTLSQKYAKDNEVFLSFAKENGKNVVQIQRTYYGVITDAIEGCFGLDVESDGYTFEIAVAENAGYRHALYKAIEIEDKIGRFYSTAAEQSQSLLADIPRAFTMIAKKRSNRTRELRSILEKEGL